MLKVKFLGSLRHFAEIQELSFNYENCITMKELLSHIAAKLLEIKGTVVNQLQNSTSNTLILVNGKEIGVLNGLETMLEDEDEVVLIPFVHGG